ncbi:MAG: aspartate kinase [Spirochaetales bacterium]|nr:aspartate kinase [Spirochaetales bacterium]
MKIMKFGGSSVANGARIKSVAEIIINEEKTGKTGIVLSAMKGVTDMMIESAWNAEKGKPEYVKIIETVRQKHFEAIDTLFPQDKKEEIKNTITEMLHEIEEILHGVKLLKECSKRSMDFIMSFGEKLSCKLMAAYLTALSYKATYIDASENFIITDNQHGSATVHFQQSYENIQKKLKKADGIPVITGFIASTEIGLTTTLGRNGSDYTASIIGAALNAECVEIWTDVDGVLSADPRIVANAFVIPELSYQEAMELSYFGAEVIHPYTMIPVVDKKIDIVIKNTLNPSAKGTLIADKVKRHTTVITGIACIDDVGLINVEGGGMIGIPGMASHILGEIAKAKLNIIMISQASSEHSICLVFKVQEAEKARKILNQTLQFDIKNKKIQNIELKGDLVVMAVIGENMRGTPGISGNLFSALGKEKINVFAIAQGSSERNISFIVGKKDKEKTLNTLHKVFLEK